MQTTYLEGVIKLFGYYKSLGDKTFIQLTDKDIQWQYNAESNSIAMVVKHIWGNMLSRWTDFLTSDGEKPWRERDAEFENDITTKTEMIEKWEAGWKCLFDALNTLNESDLEKIVFIRNEGHTALDAINRQLAHYPYHIGQIVYIAKMIKDENWNSLSIPRNKSNEFNADKFGQDRQIKHFTDGIK
ncbi:MAG: DUF1572 family protein [Bacteroidota bacterium]